MYNGILISMIFFLPQQFTCFGVTRNRKNLFQ